MNLTRHLATLTAATAFVALAGGWACPSPANAQDDEILREELPQILLDPDQMDEQDPDQSEPDQTEPDQIGPEQGHDLPPASPEGAQDDTPSIEEIEPTPQKKETRVKNPVAEFAGLDKITGRIISFDVYINETVQFGALQVTPKVCYSRPDAEEPKTDTFVEVDEITLDRKIRRIFTGWMFAESPGISAVEHPVYDVWLKTCKQKSDVPPPETAKTN